MSYQTDSILYTDDWRNPFMTTNQEPTRRNDVIRCEQCGEDYSVTYKCCPFCDERPGRPRAGVSGRRVAGRSANPLQIVGLVLSLVLIISALFIVFTTLSPLLNKKDPAPIQSQSSVSSSVTQSNPDNSEPDVSTPDISTPDVSTPDVSKPEPPAVDNTVKSIQLSNTDFTLAANQTHTLKATVNPSDAKVTWTSSNTKAAVVDENGKVTNVNTGSSQVKVTITATAGDQSAQCTVYCRGGSGNSSNSTSPTNKSGKVTGAGGGLNVRSSPSSSSEVIASLTNGAPVTILGDAGSGWYKISFAGIGGKNTVGYVSKNFISVK